MKYLSYFIFPNKDIQDDYLFDRGINFSYYPFRVLSKNQLERIELEDITILYGGNGSGKSTALNVVAEKLKVNRDSMFNKTIYFDDFVNMCKIDYLEDIPKSSRIVTSDDVFDFMLDIRSLNEGVTGRRKEVQDEFLKAKYSDFKLKTMSDYDELKKVTMARTKSQTKYVNSEVMKTIETRSNGENAFKYFIEKVEENGFYILDEPENSLSPQMQIELKSYIENSARFFGCQFLISTHSPFLLSIKNSRIYDLDASPVRVRKWTELENVKIYYDFFMNLREEF